jgi:hypothetical protein
MVKRKSENRRSTRVSVRLATNLEKRLAAYALAAGAAGVGAIIGAPLAEAQVVFTNTWVPISPTTTTTNIDLNNDGVVDFVLSQSRTCTTGTNAGGCRFVMNILPQASQNAVLGAKTYASALASGVSVGSNGPFQAGKRFMAKGADEATSSGGTRYSSLGQWKQATNLFVGVKFTIAGETHYGWIRVDLDATDAGFYGAISGYAYQSTANEPIKTGQKSGTDSKPSGRRARPTAGLPLPSERGLGRLAAGALGLQVAEVSYE